MVEPSCFAQGLDHAPHKSNANSQVSIASALGGSVSFGRFLSESLDWGKWSSFCQKRYLEEAAKYSTPGSVAQKKAFFEARYKKKHTAATQPEPEAEECRDEPSKIFDSNENQNEGNSMELTKPLSDKKPLEEICVNEQNIGGSTEKKVSPTLKSSAHRSTRPPPPPFLKNNGRKESTTPISGKNKRGSIERKKSSTPTSVHASVNFTRSRTGSTTPLTNKCSPVMKKARETKVFTGSLTPSTNKPSPVMKKAKETKASSNGVSTFATLTPHSEHGRVGSPFKQIPSVGKQVDVKKHSVGYSNRSSIKGDREQSEVASSLKTNKRVEKRKKFFNNLENKAGRKEVKELQLQGTDEEIAGNEIKELRQSLCFKARPLPDFYRNTGLSKHEVKKFFNNLENKAGRKEVKELQLQGTDEEIAGNEIKELRQSLCFKARPLPDFYRNTGLSKHEVKKSPSQNAKSPQSRKEQQPQSKTKAELSLPPPLRRPAISDRSKQVGENGSKRSCRSAILNPNKCK